MARINRYKKSSRGKEIKCSKCGRVIQVGEEYLMAIPFRQRPITRCIKCSLRPYETSHSEYVRAVGAIVEEWLDDFGISDDTVDELTSAIEEVRDECQEKLDNMPYQLRDGDTGTILQERIEACDQAIDDLASVSFDECKDEAEEEAKDEMGEVYDPKVHTDYANEAAFKAALENLIQAKAEERFTENIDAALSNLEY